MIYIPTDANIPSESCSKVRIAKYFSLTNFTSRRSAEKLILEGRVTVNGAIVMDLATRISPASDIVKCDGVRLLALRTPRIWLYHKPVGLVVSHNDELGRSDIFSDIKRKLNVSHIISVGRLDLSSEGLMIITNSGEIARHFESPANEFVRVYHVRCYGGGMESDAYMRKQLLEGIVIDGQAYRSVKMKPIKEYAPSQQPYDARGARDGDYRGLKNIWYEVELREGKNREIRKIFEYFGFKVNRLIRVQYGEYVLGDLRPGELKVGRIEIS